VLVAGCASPLQIDGCSLAREQALVATGGTRARAILFRLPGLLPSSGAKTKEARPIPVHRGPKEKKSWRCPWRLDEEEERGAMGPWGVGGNRSTHDAGVCFSRQSFFGVRPGGNR